MRIVREKGVTRGELGRAGAVADGADDRDVLELLRRGGRAQQHPAAAHVAAPDERRRKDEPRSENRAQHLDVLLRRDAAEQHELRIGARCVAQRAGRLLERRAIAGIPEIDLGVGKAHQYLRRDGRLGRHQSLIRRDDERAAELARVGDLAAEVQPAHVGEQLAYRHTFAREDARRRKTSPSARAPAGRAARGSSPARAETRESTSLVRFYQRHAARPSRQHREADEKQHQRREREIPRGRVKRAAA